MEITEEQLMAYADGALDAQQRSIVEQALAAQPELGARLLQRHRALRTSLSNAYDPVLMEAIPARLLAAKHPERKPGRTVRSWASPVWLAAAASVLLGVALGWRLPRGDGGQLLQMRPGSMVAQGSLAAALSTQLAARQTGSEPIHVGISYRDRQGNYCRTFSTTGARSLAGLACRTPDSWQVQMLSTVEQGGEGSYRAAATSLPPEILNRVQADIDGAALDASQEAAAASSHWRP